MPLKSVRMLLISAQDDISNGLKMIDGAKANCKRQERIKIDGTFAKRLEILSSKAKEVLSEIDSIVKDGSITWESPLA